MATYKRGDTYWYEFVLRGRRVRKSTHQGNQHEAKTMEAAHRLQIAKGEVGLIDRPKVPTLREFAPRFIKQISMDCASKPRTIEFYQSKLNRILAEKLADLPLDEIDTQCIEQYKVVRRDSMSTHKKRVSPASVNRELATLRRLLRMAHEWKKFDRLPKIKLLRGEGQREFVLSREMEETYINALPPLMRDLAPFLIDTGLRVGEALKLEWSEVTGSGVRVRRLHSKNSKTRTIPLTPRALGILTAKRDRSGLVFRNTDTGPLYHTWLDQQHAEVRKALGLPSDFVLHSLRHTFGTRLGETGTDAFTIMKLMGHSSVAISQKYVHPSSESDRLAIERLSGASPFGPTQIPHSNLELVKVKRAK